MGPATAACCRLETVANGQDEVCGIAEAERGQSDLAAQTAGSPHGPWRLGKSPALHIAFPTRIFDFARTSQTGCRQSLNQPNRRVRTRTHGGVTGKASDSLPMSIKKSRARNGRQISRVCVALSGLVVSGLCSQGSRPGLNILRCFARLLPRKRQRESGDTSPTPKAHHCPARESRNAAISCPLRTRSTLPASTGWFHVLPSIAGNCAISVNCSVVAPTSASSPSSESTSSKS